jgi:hypothetical protein
MRTGISEDPKGDLSKEVPAQPDPARPGRTAEPLLPPDEGATDAAGPDAPEQQAKTAGDRAGQSDASTKR